MDVTAQNVLLDSWLGAAKAAGMPASFDLALFDGHPDDGTELDATGGYARVTVANDGATWPAADSGVKTSASVDLAGTSTYGTVATHWRLYSGGTAYFTGTLDTPVSEPTDTVTLSVALTEATEGA